MHVLVCSFISVGVVGIWLGSWDQGMSLDQGGTQGLCLMSHDGYGAEAGACMLYARVKACEGPLTQT